MGVLEKQLRLVLYFEDYSIDKGNFFIKNFFFSINVKLCIVWEWFIAKNYFIHTKIFVLRLFKMLLNQSECSRFEQRLVIKFLVDEKCKACEIYGRMFDVFREVCLNQKMFTNRLNMSLLLWAWTKKTVHGVGTVTLQQRKSTRWSAVNKESHTETLLRYDRTYHYWFPWKRCNSKQYFLLSNPLAKFILFIEWPLYLQ